MWEVRRPKTYCTSLSQCKCKWKTGDVQWNISLPWKCPPHSMAMAGLKQPCSLRHGLAVPMGLLEGGSPDWEPKDEDERKPSRE